MGKVKKNRWKQTVAPQGRKVLTHAHHFVSSLSKLLRFIWQNLVNQCFRFFVRIREKIYISWQKSVRRVHRIWILTKRALCNAWHRFVGICYRIYLLAKSNVIKIAILYRKAYLATQDRLISSWHKLIQVCHDTYTSSLEAICKTMTASRDFLISSWHKLVHVWQTLCKTAIKICNCSITLWKQLKEGVYRVYITTCSAFYKWSCGIVNQLYATSISIRSVIYSTLIHFIDQCLTDYYAIKETMCVSWQWTTQKCITLGTATRQKTLYLYQHFSATIRSCKASLNFFYRACVRFVCRTSQHVLCSVKTASRTIKSLSISFAQSIQQMCKTGWVMSSRFIFAKCHSFKAFCLHLLLITQSCSVKIANKSLLHYRRILSTVKHNYIVLKRFVEEKRKAVAFAKEQLFLSAENYTQQLISNAQHRYREAHAFTKQTILAVHEKRRSVVAWAQKLKRRPAPEPEETIQDEPFSIKEEIPQMTPPPVVVEEVKPAPVRNLRWQFAMSSSLALSLAMGTYLYINSIHTDDLAVSPSTPLASIVPPMLAEPPAVIAAALPPVQPSPVEPKKGGYSFWPKRVTLRHVEGWGEGVSFGTDYSTLAFLVAPDYRVGRVMPMLDLRGHRFDNNRYAANVGLAGRYIPKSNGFCQILGFNTFWDWRQGHKGTYNQLGAGLEVLGKRWDFRANGYAPIGVKRRKTKCVFDQYEGGYFAIHRECEFTSYGFNAEVGYYAVRSDNFFLYAAIGPYYLVRKCHDRTRGGMFRIRPQYKDYLAIDASVSYDSVFKTVYQAQIIFYLPLYQLSKKGNQRPCNLTDYQIYQPIERFEVMPLGKRSCWQRNF